MAYYHETLDPMIQAIPFGRHNRKACLGPEASLRLLLPSLLAFILVTALMRGCGLPALPPLLTEPGIPGRIASGVPHRESPPRPQPGEPEFPARAAGVYSDILWFADRDLLLDRAAQQTEFFPGEVRNHYCVSRAPVSQRQGAKLTGKRPAR